MPTPAFDHVNNFHIFFISYENFNVIKIPTLPFEYNCLQKLFLKTVAETHEILDTVNKMRDVFWSDMSTGFRLKR